MWKWIRIPKGIALAAFVLPWMTISCAGNRIASASGFGLTFGKLSSDLPNAQAQTSGQGLDIWLVLALIAIVAGLVISFQRFTRRNALIVAATSGAAAVLVWVGTLRFGKSALMAEMSKHRGAADGASADPFGAQMGDAAAAAIQIDWGFGFWLTLLALIAAGVMAWLAYSGRDAAVERSLRGSMGGTRPPDGGF